MLLDSIRSEVPFNPYVNTGTLLDLSTGAFVPGTNGYILNGGLSVSMGVTGRTQTFKSNLATSFLTRVLNIHPQAEALVYESEGFVPGPEHYDNFLAPWDKPVSDRIVFKNKLICNLSEFYKTFMEIVKKKIDNKKDYLVESPFLNPRTGKPYKVWIPTFVLIDSFSLASSAKAEELFSKNSVDASGMNTLYLNEGMVKTRIMDDLPSRAASAGCYFILTAHVGNKFDLDPYNKSPKQLQYMKNTDKIKDVGSKFEFNTSTMLQTLKATNLLTPDKRAEYPSKTSNSVDVNLVETMTVRGKNNASGNITPYITSQSSGILEGVTNFDFLRSHKEFGFEVKGNKQGFIPCLKPDVTLTKATVRDITSTDYETYRALEILTQLCYIQHYWNIAKLPPFITTPPQALADKLMNNQKLTISRVLNSTGVWSTSKQERERLTLIDILKFLDQEDTHPKSTIGKK